MKKTVRKWFWAWESDKEEAWLNAMVAKGWTLVDVGWCRYVFEEKKSDYIYRLELLENLPKHAESQAYIRFVEETGAEYIGAVTRWAYFRRSAALGPFELYSDNQSRLKYAKRIMALLLPLFLANIWPFIYNLMIYACNGHRMISFVCAMLSLEMSILLGIGMYQVGKNIQSLRKKDGFYE